METATRYYRTEATQNLTATDLAQVAADAKTRGEEVQTASFEVAEDENFETAQAERGDVLYIPSVGRAGIAWGADADWTDADSIEDAIERYLGIDGKEMVL